MRDSKNKLLVVIINTVRQCNNRLQITYQQFSKNILMAGIHPCYDDEHTRPNHMSHTSGSSLTTVRMW